MPPKFDMQAARDLLQAYAPGFARPCEVEALAAALDEIARLQNECRQCVNADILAQAKRIAELEGALVEERAKICRIALPCEENCECGKTRPHADWKDCPNRAKWQQIARQQLRQEGHL